jgi:hypothetical protein
MYRGADYTPGDTVLIRSNTITCGEANQYGEGIYLSYTQARVEQNTITGDCYGGIRAYNDATSRPLVIRDNMVTMTPSLSYGAIDIEGNFRFEIVANTIEGGTANDAPGAITIGYYYTPTASGRVDSNTIRFPRYWGVLAENVDTLQVRGNLIEDFRSLCCGSVPGAIAARPQAAAALTRIVGNTVRRSQGRAVNVEQYSAGAIEVDSNAVSQADTAAMRIYSYGPATVRGNNIRNNARLGLDLPYNSGTVHQVHGNAFQGNGQFAIGAGYDSVDATGNWWGVDDSLPNTPGADQVSGRVNATAPLSAAPAGPPLAPPFARTAAVSAARTTVVAAPSASARVARVRETPPLRAPQPVRTLRRSGNATLELAPPRIVAQRAVELARTRALRAQADSADAARDAERARPRTRRVP